LEYLLVFQAYINEMHGSRKKSLVKIPFGQRYAEGFNSGVKGLIQLKILALGPRKQKGLFLEGGGEGTCGRRI
jgi:hypothetical protein